MTPVLQVELMVVEAVQKLAGQIPVETVVAHKILRYKQPYLYLVSASNLTNGICCNGNSADFPPASCSVGSAAQSDCAVGAGAEEVCRDGNSATRFANP